MVQPWAFMGNEIATILADEFDEFKRKREAAGMVTGTLSAAAARSQFSLKTTVSCALLLRLIHDKYSKKFHGDKTTSGAAPASADASAPQASGPASNGSSGGQQSPASTTTTGSLPATIAPVAVNV